MIKNIKRLGMTDSKYPLYKECDADSYPICHRFNIGFAASGSSGKRQGLYEVTETVDKQLFKVVGEKEHGAALTGRAKMKSDYTLGIYCALIAAAAAPSDANREFAAEEAEKIIKDNES